MSDHISVKLKKTKTKHKQTKKIKSNKMREHFGHPKIEYWFQTKTKASIHGTNQTKIHLYVSAFWSALRFVEFLKKKKQKIEADESNKNSEKHWEDILFHFDPTIQLSIFSDWHFFQ